MKVRVRGKVGRICNRVDDQHAEFLLKHSMDAPYIRIAHRRKGSIVGIVVLMLAIDLVLWLFVYIKGLEPLMVATIAIATVFIVILAAIQARTLNVGDRMERLVSAIELERPVMRRKAAPISELGPTATDPLLAILREDKRKERATESRPTGEPAPSTATARGTYGYEGGMPGIPQRVTAPGEWDVMSVDGAEPTPLPSGPPARAAQPPSAPPTGPEELPSEPVGVSHFPTGPAAPPPPEPPIPTIPMTATVSPPPPPPPLPTPPQADAGAQWPPPPPVGMPPSSAEELPTDREEPTDRQSIAPSAPPPVAPQAPPRPPPAPAPQPPPAPQAPVAPRPPPTPPPMPPAAPQPPQYPPPPPVQQTTPQQVQPPQLQYQQPPPAQYQQPPPAQYQQPPPAQYQQPPPAQYQQPPPAQSQYAQQPAPPPAPAGERKKKVEEEEEPVVDWEEY